MSTRPSWLGVIIIAAVAAMPSAQRQDASTVLKGSEAFGDWRTDKPGVRRLS